MASSNIEGSTESRNLTRRQFVMRLGVVGLSVTAVSTLLSACGGAAAPAVATVPAAAAPAATAVAAVAPTVAAGAAAVAPTVAAAAAAAAPTVVAAAAAAATAMPAAAATAMPAAAPTTAAAAPTTGAAAASTRPLTPTFYSWITNLHPSIPAINTEFSATTPLNFQIAPTQGFGIDRFVAEAKDKNSTWDVYVGMTPFVEMTALIKADVIEPWDNYISKDILDDIIPSIRAECTVDGKLYSWPWLLDIIGMGWNTEITDKAGIKDNPPKDWDTYMKFGQQVVDSKAASYGVTFDAHGWRSLAPITHSKNTKVYYDDGAGGLLFDFTNPDALAALELMKKMKDLSGPNVLNPGTIDGGVNDTPDENMFAAQEVAYYIKYFNAPLRFAATWPDPKKLALASLPKWPGGEGSTVFWTTGSCLFKYGQNKDKAVEYLKKLTYDDRIWQNSIQGTPTGHPGQLPPYKSLYAKWDANKPDWMEDFVPLVRSQLDVAKAIPNHKYGLTQFFIGQPGWEKYLKGEQPDVKKAAQEAKDLVAAENKKNP